MPIVEIFHLAKNPTYRPVVAFFFAALVLQVFVLQGLHHVMGHQHEAISECDQERPHIHAEGHQHFSCNICLFHFAPSDLAINGLVVYVPKILGAPSNFTYKKRPLAQRLRQSCSRGPPAVFA